MDSRLDRLKGDTMDSDPLRYDKWIEEALRGVVRQALVLTTAEGLPGEHHFYITFRTDADGVEMPDYLRAEHPENITIVLQHQFENLEVENDFFRVSLRFKGKLERLRVPFDAVGAFADPSVNFGLQLKMTTIEEDEGLLNDELLDDEISDLDLVANDGDDALGADNANADEETPKTGEVIALDSFRKK